MSEGSFWGVVPVRARLPPVRPTLPVSPPGSRHPCPEGCTDKSSLDPINLGWGHQGPIPGVAGPRVVRPCPPNPFRGP